MTKTLLTVQNFKSKMSTDCNDLNMSMVKSIIAHIVKHLKHIYNVSFNTGIFPNQMKIAKVIPIFKSGEKDVFTHYRPISLLPQFLKILEKLYCDRLDSFLFKYSILSPSQYGFRSNISTSHALIELVEEITASLDNNKYAIGMLTLRRHLILSTIIYWQIVLTFMAFMVLHINGL